MTVELTTEEIDRYWSKVQKSDGCWLWTDVPNSDGYGTFAVSRPDGRLRFRPHRLALTLAGVQLLDGKVADHICRNRMCVNPDHLRQVTNRENILAGVGATAVNKRKTHCIHGHPFDEANTMWSRAGARICRACRKRQRKRVVCEVCGAWVFQLPRHKRLVHPLRTDTTHKDQP